MGIRMGMGMGEDKNEDLGESYSWLGNIEHSRLAL